MDNYPQHSEPRGIGTAEREGFGS